MAADARIFSILKNKILVCKMGDGRCSMGFSVTVPSFRNPNRL